MHIYLWSTLCFETQIDADLPSEIPATPISQDERGFLSQLGVLVKLCSESELSPQRLAFGHRAVLKRPNREAG